MIARRELGILRAAAGPTAALMLEQSASCVRVPRSGSRLVSVSRRSQPRACATGVSKGFGRAGTLLAVAVNLALGSHVVALKVPLAHGLP